MMRLNNIYQVGHDQPVNICISGGKIVNHVTDSALQLVFDRAMVFPGMINSHDHLNFNLFPQLGNRIYKNYTEWGHFIHQHYSNEIEAILKVPNKLRTQWGIYKNLLCGVTTVIDHGDEPAVRDAPITVLKTMRSLHSVHFGERWKIRLNLPFKRHIPVVIHTGEGTDQAAADEIDQLIRWNLLGRELIGVHGVAMTPDQAKHFKALVWCPISNHFLLGSTANIGKIKQIAPILFGTDSTLTGSWNVWDHIRTARRTGSLTDDELLQHISATPANIWGVNSGKIASGYDADIVVARIKDGHTIEHLFNTDPADILLVVHKGSIGLFDEILYSQLGDLPKDGFSKVAIDGRYKYICGDLPGLISEIKQYAPHLQFPVTTAN